MKYKTKAIINAPAEDVYQVLTDASNYPKFDPNCIKIEGVIELGESIKIHSKLSPKRAFRVKVKELQLGEKMVWESALPLDLFKGVRTFTIKAKDDLTTEFYMEEVFSGPLLAIFKRLIPDMSEAFKQFSSGLKKFIESRP